MVARPTETVESWVERVFLTEFVFDAADAETVASNATMLDEVWAMVEAIMDAVYTVFEDNEAATFEDA